MLTQDVKIDQYCLDLNKDRPYDVGVIGGYGNVGIETVNYLFNNASRKLLVGGRNVSKGGRILRERKLHDISVQQIDIFNEDQIRNFCCQCRIVINCAGPSHLIEDRIAKIAAETATNFLDIGIMEVLMDKVGGFTETLKKNNCACVYGTGLHPGLDDIFAFYADQKAAEIMDEFDSLENRLGDTSIWNGTGSLRDIVWGIHAGYMNAYFGYYQNGKWKQHGAFNAIKKRYFPGIGKRRCALMFQPLLKPLVSRYKKIICYGWFEFSLILTALKIKYFMKNREVEAVQCLGDFLKKRGEKFASLPASCYLYAVVKGKKNNKPVTLRVSLTLAGHDGYWCVAIIPAVAAQMMLNNQIRFVGAKSLVEIVDPATFMEVLENKLGLKCEIEHT